MQEALQCDVLVIGGGPAGSTAATLLARKGWQVLQLEKDSHPRFHIGESLLPCNLPILEQLGVLDEIEAIGVRKLGADFPATEGRYQTFHFARALGQSPDHAFQVKREEFDRILFENARANGVDARERTCVTSVSIDGPGSVQARAREASGTELSIKARYLVDASGRDTVLGRQFRLKRKNAVHQSAAIFAHFESVERRDGEDAGNISIYHFEQGWCWFIPLRDGLMSIGCVCWPEFLKQRKGSNEAFLMQTLQRMPEAWSRMQAARIRGEVRVTGNYSYTCSRMCGPGWIMAGDAWAFVDPVFSSGVYLAMHSGTAAAALVDACLRDGASEKRLQRAYDRRIRRGVRVFSWFIYRFNSPVMRGLFANPRNHWRVEEGLVSMLAGDVFDNAPVMRRMRLFKLIYAVTSLLSWARWRSERVARRRQARIEFSGGSTPVDPA
ncbi:NAD(P)/FAD-dependent oxidoreductase [Dokdonella sp.]|uniref:NAD(P)/FAD-dependent oxidoreductase n=1 Tax=Dokdonella sp. TaxID=2291710 RepID=UPI003529B30A